ncbi:glycosyltransferase [Geodermatophilus nigrescens]|uniref:Teichuronic acid biosynthesis glycosyltransferase TuaH n=1 Tax=Geodermatophilus nigrescens TaxID=1070870 RepID=A0A1M5E4R5_9ACTN|nr:glycosyltransferase [Geodermatophilus nigrescens]SHF74239.1 teichuronic acid biosynthesis glycosyltransferase TuaH [Geodermatophilus nigrescens]
MIPSGSVVWFPGVGWDEVTGTDRLLATEVSRQRPVLWVDPPVPLQHWLRTEGLRGLLRPVRCIRRSPSLVTIRTVGPPWPNRRATWRLSSWRAGRAARAALRRTGPRPTVEVVATPQPRPRTGGTRVYYATDDFAAGAALLRIDPARLAGWEHRQLTDARVRLAISPALARRWSETGHDSLVLPNGCDPGLRRRVATASRPEGFRLSGPVAGVVGQLSPRLDLALLEAVADAGLSLLLVGPLDPALEPARAAALLARERVQWVGRQPVERLPGYLAAMDVGLTPYRRTAFNEASIPLKTLEYLAAGVPVVSTPLPALDLLPAGLVTTAGTPEAFAEAAALAAAGPPAGWPERSLAWARENSWGARADTLLAAADEHGGLAPVRPAWH